MAAFLATAGRTLPGKIMGITLPIVAFVALGVQHSPANMGYFSVGLIEGGSGIDWLDAIWWSIVPATIGNILGGTLLVALLFCIPTATVRISERSYDEPINSCAKKGTRCQRAWIGRGAGDGWVSGDYGAPGIQVSSLGSG